MNERIVYILVKRIESNGINPVTKQPMKLEDIKDVVYKTEVGKILNQ